MFEEDEEFEQRPFKCLNCVWFENEYCKPETRWDAMDEIDECEEFVEVIGNDMDRA